MTLPSQLYSQSLALLTDLYQLTMAYGYWKAGTDRREAVFQLSFRNHPFGILCKANQTIQWQRTLKTGTKLFVHYGL